MALARAVNQARGPKRITGCWHPKQGQILFPESNDEQIRIRTSIHVRLWRAHPRQNAVYLDANCTTPAPLATAAASGIEFLMKHDEQNLEAKCSTLAESHRQRNRTLDEKLSSEVVSALRFVPSNSKTKSLQPGSKVQHHSTPAECYRLQNRALSEKSLSEVVFALRFAISFQNEKLVTWKRSAAPEHTH